MSNLRFENPPWPPFQFPEGHPAETYLNSLWNRIQRMREQLAEAETERELSDAKEKEHEEAMTPDLPDVIYVVEDHCAWYHYPSADRTKYVRAETTARVEELERSVIHYSLLWSEEGKKFDKIAQTCADLRTENERLRELIDEVRPFVGRPYYCVDGYEEVKKKLDALVTQGARAME